MALRILRVSSPQFVASNKDHHVEFGEARPDSCTPSKDVAPYPCWTVLFYDYETRAGYQASVSSGRVAIQSYGGGVAPSPEEAAAATAVALADPSVSKALASGGWTPWLYETSPGRDSSPCRIERCILLRRWDGGNVPLAVVVNLHRHSIEWSELP